MLGVLGVLAAGASCHGSLDTTRKAPPKATLGDDIYGVLCDRVGATSFTEDQVGASYQGICHYDDQGNWQDTVDLSALPPVTGDKAIEARRLGVAKLEAMVRWRSDLIHAINATFADVDIDNIATEQQGDTIKLHDALLALSQTMSPLYESNPFEPSGKPLMPASTEAIGRLFDALAKSDEATSALSKIWGRQGYRPSPLSLGAVRTALGYPGLRDMIRASLAVLGPGGAAAPQMQSAYAAGKQKLLSIKPSESQLEPLTVDEATAQPSRPRSGVELMSAVMLRQDDAFAESDATAPSYIARRDRRGFALTAREAGPFVDGDGDGLADVDLFGRFVDGSGAPLAVDPPFAIPGVAPTGPLDELGRPATPLYAYLDTSRTLTGAVVRSLRPLVDATQYASPDDPEPWKSEHEAFMYTLAGARLLLGDREDASYDFDAEKILPPGPCAQQHCVQYSRFRGEDSPLADLAHAAGQMIADEDSDAVLLGLMDLVEHHEDAVARLVGAALKVREIALDHDALAAQGKEPLAELSYETPIWDEAAAVMGRIVEHEGLTAHLIEAFASDDAITPHGPSQHMGNALATMLRMRDRFAYDPTNLNGPAVNVTVGAPSTDDPRTPVDQTKPKVGDNRSCMERLFLTIHDASGAKTCNKAHGQVAVKLPLFGLNTFGDYDACSLISIDNLAAYFLNSNLPDGHPKRSKLDIRNDFLSGLLSFGQVIGLDINGIFQDGSGIQGLTLNPTSAALTRLVFFGADSDKWPSLPDLDPYRGEDERNEGTNIFISSLLEPAGTVACGRDANGVNDCDAAQNLMRLRDADTLFLLERVGLADYLRPVSTAFADLGPDYTGEQLFLDLMNTMYRHWPGKEHGPECSKQGTRATNPSYCSEAGVNAYEPIAADALDTDLVPALQAFSKIVTEISKVTVQRGPKADEVWTGAKVLEKSARVLFSPEYAASVGLKDRRGSKSTTWVDGTKQEQATVFTLFADALHGIDVRFDQSSEPDAKERKSQWKRGRSELVDALAAVEGTGPDAHFKNRSLPKIALSLLAVTREQLNANCPDRETTKKCDWARTQFGEKVVETLSGPLAAALLDIAESLRANEPARRETEKFLAYMLDASSEDASFQGLLASMSDFVQILSNDDILAPILNAAATASNAEDDAEGPGAADTGLRVLKALNEDAYDRYHALDEVLKTAVTPMSETDPRAPIQVFMDAIADVNRIDASSKEPLAAADYRQIFITLRDFMIDNTRGLEQFYAIVQKRPHE